MNTLCVNIAVIRRRWHLSQEAFADLLGATRPQVSNWERGRTAPPVEALLLLQAVSGIDVDRLSFEELTWEAIPDQPGAAPAPASSEERILQAIAALGERLERLEALLLEVAAKK